MLAGANAIQHHNFAPFHGDYVKEHDELIALGEDPPPEVPGGHSDGRYTSKWRFEWPQGVTDNAKNDEDVLNLKGHGRKKKKEKDVYTYPWTLDSDIVDSQKHLSDVEGILEKPLDLKIY